jgi:ribonucleoside-triphosphate reductase
MTTRSTPRRKARPAPIKLPDRFVARYATQQPDWGPLGWVTYKRTYARWADRAQTRREEWYETVRRVVEGNLDLDPRERTPAVVRELVSEGKEMFDAIFNLTWTPPGRGLWISGTDYARRVGDALVNCVSGDTLVHTADGLVPAAELAGRQVPTLSEGGVYRLAQWDQIGEQELFRVLFANGDEMLTTAGHQWIVTGSAGSERVTTEELVGRHVPLQHIAKFIYDEPSYQQGVRHGMVFGDGSLAVGSNDKAHIKAFDTGKKALAERFFNETSVQKHSQTGGTAVYAGKQPAAFKQLPSADEGRSYLRGFIAGLIATDGYVNRAGAVVVHNASYETLAALRRLAAEAGLPTTRIRMERENNPWTGESAPIYALAFVKAGMRDDHMIIRESHRKHMNASPVSNKRTTMRVVSVTPTGRVEPVYCCLEPETHSWVAGAGYLTSNCWFVSLRPGEYFEGDGVKCSFPFVMGMDLLMKGGGVGFSATRENVSQFPMVKTPVRLHIVCDNHHPNFGELDAGLIPQMTHTMIKVEDTRRGWTDALRVVIDAHFKAPRDRHIVFDVSEIRAAGEPIRGFGGTAAGPGPLVRMLREINSILNDRVGGFLSPVEVTDMMNMVGKCVVAGNVRRSAEIALGSADDLGFIGMKLDEEKLMSHRWASNNSIVIDSEFEDFDRIADAISANGEPGIFNIELSQTRLRLGDDRTDERNLLVEGTNPCGEVSLESGSACNLAECYPAIAERKGYDMERILRMAMRYTKRITCANYEWELSRRTIYNSRRTGVSLSGIFDWIVQRDAASLAELEDQLDTWYDIVRDEDERYSAKLDIPTSVAVSTIKPSGTVSLLSGSSPGMHAHQAPYYIRRIRFQEKDPLVAVLTECGFHVEPDAYSPNTVVAEFPVAAPGADSDKFRGAGDLTIEEQLETQAVLQRVWSDNAVSATVTFRPREKRKIAGLLREYRDQLKSTSLLPYTDPGETTSYKQMPYEPITKERYEELTARIVRWPHEVATDLHETKKAEFEVVDQADCVGGACPIR